MSSFCVSTDETHSSKKAIFFSFQTEWKIWVIFDIMAYQRLPEYQISFLLFKLSELGKFQMSSFSVSTDETHSSKTGILFSFQTEWKKWVIFDIMAYQRLPEYQISFPLFKLSELGKFQMSSFSVSTDETHSSKKGICSHSKQNEKNESYLTQRNTRGFKNIKLVSLHWKSVNRKNSKCLHFASVQMKHKVQKRPFFSFQTEWKKWVIFDMMLYQRLDEYQISFPLFKVSELWKFQMSSFCISTDETHSSKRAIFLSFQTEWKIWVIFDTMAYQRLPEYQFGFPSFKVSEPWKLQMSSFCVSTDETHSSKKVIFFSPNRMKRMSHIWHNVIPKAWWISN